MITKNATFGETQNVVVCEFGSGDVWMVGSELGENQETVLGFKTVKESKQINKLVETSIKSYDEMKPELVFIFNEVDSIDCLISMLGELKKEMLPK